MLENLLINRVIHHINKIEYINENQFGFTPQTRTADVVMAVKNFIEPQLEKGRVVFMASLDVREAFDPACWSAIIKGLREVKCTQNLYG